MNFSKTSILGILTILGAVINFVIDVVQHGSITPSGLGVAAAAIPSGIGLLLAKDFDHSNSPTPLAVSQTVVPVPAVRAEPAVIPKE